MSSSAVLDELRELIARHCVTVAGKSRELSSVLVKLSEPQVSLAQTVEAAISLTHEIRGSAGSIGFSEVSSAATALENFLKTLRGLQTCAPAAALDEISCRLDALTEATASLRPESSHLYNADVSAMIRR
ncbi:MAG: Hpt domain-containing protein [Parvularculaceae bacterium]